ncbi:hypothetical protein D9758_015221 [Tetrapyrgos nigripes]|uniref:Uncharacterized protein n=1 Tax=Tetrapyrgos nigripes TaxID=182062 RepID=A0A8H5CK10_9AGAR|nr:hypothetical protein D9758_015221 [Tetrapyrgos nigripes]
MPVVTASSQVSYIGTGDIILGALFFLVFVLVNLLFMYLEEPVVASHYEEGKPDQNLNPSVAFDLNTGEKRSKRCYPTILDESRSSWSDYPGFEQIHPGYLFSDGKEHQHL